MSVHQCPPRSTCHVSCAFQKHTRERTGVENWHFSPIIRSPEVGKSYCSSAGYHAKRLI